MEGVCCSKSNGTDFKSNDKSNTTNNEYQKSLDIKIYQQRPGTCNVGTEYEYLIPTLLALRGVCMPELTDMWLGTNVDGMGAFDDVLLSLQYGNDRKETYFMQLKHTSSTISASSFSKRSDDFSLLKYYNSFETIISKSKTNDINILDNFGNMFFIIYTTADLTDNINQNVMDLLNLTLFQEDLPEDVCRILCTNFDKNGCIYRFKTVDTSKSVFSEEFLSRFYIFIKQGKTVVIEDLIQRILSDTFGKLNKNIGLNFINFMKTWERGNLGKQFRLHKGQIKQKLLEILLDPFLVEPKCFLKFSNTSLWLNVVKSAELTFVENYKEEGLFQMWTAINTDVYKYCDLQLKNCIFWDALTDLTIDNLPRKFKRMNLDHFGHPKEFSMKYLCILLWRSGLIPLIFKIDDLNELKSFSDIFNILNDEGSKKHYILYHKINNLDYSKYFKKVAVVQNLCDINDENLIKLLLDNMKISLQGKQQIKLSCLLKEDFKNIFKTISAGLILSMLNAPFIMGKRLGDVPGTYITRRINKLFLKKEAFQLSKNKFIVNGPKNIVNILKTLTNPERVTDNKNDFQKAIDKQNVIGLPKDSIISFKEIESPRNKNYGVHYLRYYKNKLEWTHSFNQAHDIKPYIYEITSNSNQTAVREEGFLEYFNGNLRVVSSEPGMGKTVLIQRLASRYTKDYWVIIISLTRYEKYFVDTKMLSLCDVINLHLQEERFKDFSNCLFSILQESKKLLFLIDAYDELPLELHKPLLSFVKLLMDEDYSVLITTRTTHSPHLEKVLGTLAVSLTPLTENEQIMFLTNYFNKLEKRNTKDFIDQFQRYIKTSFKKFNKQFFTNPLHLDMISQLLEDKRIKGMEELKRINMMDLFEAYLTKKLTTYLNKKLNNFNIDKLNPIFKRELEHFREMHSKSALTLFYPKHVLDSIINYEPVMAFLNNIKSGIEDFGIITSVNNNLPVFVHRTFAEYLTAKFLAGNFKIEKYKPLIKNLFDRQLISVRLIFDKILAKDKPMHLTVLENNFEDLEDLLKKRGGESEDDYDLAGRTPFHLASAWGRQHAFLQKSTNNMCKSKSKVILNQCDHLTFYSELRMNVEIVNTFLQIKEFSNKKDELFEWYPSDYAVNSQSINIIDLLIENDQSINLVHHFDQNSLTLYCVRYGYLNILKRLPLDTCISIKETLHSLFHIAIKNTSTSSKILRIILEKGNLEINKLYLEHSAEKHGPPLMFAARCGNIGAFKILLQYTADINKKYFCGMAIIHILAFYNNLDCLKEVFAKTDVDVNLRVSHSFKDYAFNNPGHTALYFAVNNNNVNIVKFLIENGASIDLTYENKRTVLHVASINGYIDCVKELCIHGANLESLDENLRTPLHYATLNAQVGSINFLLNLGADYDKMDIFKRTPIHYTIQNVRIDNINFSKRFKLSHLHESTLLHLILQQKEPKIKTVKYLLQSSNCNNWHQYATTLQSQLNLQDKLNNIQCLINIFGIDPNVTDSDGKTVLSYAIKIRSLEITQLILNLGANVNKNDNTTTSPLHYAVATDNIDIVRLILQFNPDVNQTNLFKVTPLHKAVEKGFYDCVLELINKGANINLSTIDGCTPLFVAVKQNNDNLAKLLLDNDANPNKFTYDNNLQCIKGRNNTEKIKNIVFPLHEAIRSKDLKIVQYILKSKIKINQTDKNGWTALHFAADCDYSACIKLLLDKGAAIHWQDNNGSTPIHLATRQNHKETLKCLLNVPNCIKALNKLDCNNLTALHIACKLGYLDCVKILVEKGSDVRQPTSNSLTSLDLARNCGHKNIELLLENF